MKILQEANLVVPEHELAVSLVESEQCRCGCDAWKITEVGKSVVEKLNVVFVGDNQ